VGHTLLICICPLESGAQPWNLILKSGFAQSTEQALEIIRVAVGLGCGVFVFVPGEVYQRQRHVGDAGTSIGSCFRRHDFAQITIQRTALQLPNAAILNTSACEQGITLTAVMRQRTQ